MSNMSNARLEESPDLKEYTLPDGSKVYAVKMGNLVFQTYDDMNALAIWKKLKDAAGMSLAVEITE